ncbi:ATP phosphoribosyltransferase regulatory subunit [Eubacterium oxidoreducens]|uniref:ATP phosphoribosyltransferase regulatory subunit n=1 Tax=Eubacterium oxidoreducens TaxID=1732 RepID=A0A1G6AM68_EUBOX|nr:ATP phosphoribosyltransferase regulatory subunit [Eubacterium oxidoreducens]SDB09462.1 ATP phosphoribosyltransferase regulatory subunit [Eubacterium oxidoreducens]
MKKNILHTPDGVRDLYNEQCENKLYLEHQFRKVLRRFGYHPIQTPTLEFFDVFNSQVGSVSSKNMYKLFDQEGNTMVIRPDITPSIARCVSKYYPESKMPIRMYYLGNTFVNNSSYQGRLKEVTQVGAELINNAHVDGDAEMIMMMIHALLSAGLDEFQISIGHAGFFEGLVKATNLGEELTDRITDLILNRNFWGVKELLEPLKLDADLKELFARIGDLYPDGESILKLLPFAQKYPNVKEAIHRLHDIYEVLKLYGVTQYVSFDPGMPEMHDYYTGVIFNAYSFGSGEPIAKGGRYDNLIGHFGKDAPAIGFAIVVDQIMMALNNQKKEFPRRKNRLLIMYSKEHLKEAISIANEHRSKDENVELLLISSKVSQEEYNEYMKVNNFDTIIRLDEDK